MIDAWCSERQYLDHVAPIWHQLAPDERGTFHVPPSLAPHAVALGIECTSRPPARVADTPVLVAAYQDHRRVGRRPVVYLEHGAGQTYQGDQLVAGHGSYSGGSDHDGAVLFLCPSDTVARRWRRTYPDVPAAVVGCPKLDHHHLARRATRDPHDPVVAVTFHPDTTVNAYRCPEMRSAWPHFAPALSTLAAAFDTLGHAHPRLYDKVRGGYERAGLLPVRDLGDVFDRADVLVADNTSASWEFASLGKPLVLLNAPWYRRDIEHGGRFWEWAEAGVQCDHPADLPDAVDVALCDPPQYADARARVTREVYAHTDGRAAERAVAAIRGVLHGTPVPA